MLDPGLPPTYLKHTHPMYRRILPVLFAATVLTATAAPRAWKNADGSRSFQGEFVNRDATSVTLRGENGKEFVVELSKLHADDRAWLNLHHALDGENPSAFFDTLSFSDTRESTMTKLKASKLVEMTTSEIFVGRSGLNGIFRTRQKVGGLDAFLYFDWAPSGTMKELTLQTETVPGTDYKTRLQPSWSEFVELMSALYGPPVQKSPMPSIEGLADGSFMPSHYWKLESGGSALLGTAREGPRYQLVVRFTQKKIQLVEIP